MKKLLFIALALLMAPTTALAGNEQVDPNVWRTGRGGPFGGRSDGVFQHRDRKSSAVIENGTGITQGRLGAAYFETFSYGDGIGVQCSTGLQGLNVSFELGTGADDACDDTCDELSPPAECVIGYANGGDLVVCSGTTADTCLCARVDAPDTDCATTVQTGDMRQMTFGRGVVLNAYMLGATTASANLPDMDANSLDIAADQADDEGIELYAGMHGASGRPLIVGDDPAFSFCATLAIADADGTDDYHIGWRGVEAPNDVFDDYTDVVSIGYTTDEGTTAAIVIETIVGGAGTVSTDTTQSNTNDAIELCVIVGDTGIVTYTIDGSEPATTASLTLADGLALVPFVHLLQQAELTGEADLTLWEVKFP